MYSVGVRPSYHTGFAQWPGMSEYPQLWKGLAGAWDFSLGLTGTNALDLSGYVNKGTFKGINIHYIYRPFGSVVDLDGGGDYIQSDTIHMNPHKGSISVYFNADTIDAGEEADYIFSHRTGGTDNRIYIIVGGDNDIYIRIGDSGVDKQTTDNISTGTWYHFILTWNTGVYTTYLNGLPLNSDTYTDFAVLNTFYTCGCYQDTKGSPLNYFDGKIGSLMIYNRDVNASEAILLYQLRKKLA